MKHWSRLAHGAPPPTSKPTKRAKTSVDTPTDPDHIARELIALSARIYDGVGSEEARTLPKHHRALWDALVVAAPNHEALSQALIPEGVDWPKARHEIPMGSLNKVNSDEELRLWAERCDDLAAKASLPAMSGDLAMSEKLDGLSIEVVYHDGAVDAAITSGDGV